MGTHPIFESDFDCLTECLIIQLFASTLPPSLTICQLMLVMLIPNVIVNAGTTTLTFSVALLFAKRRVRILSHASTSAPPSPRPVHRSGPPSGTNNAPKVASQLTSTHWSQPTSSQKTSKLLQSTNLFTPFSYSKFFPHELHPMIYIQRYINPFYLFSP